MDVSNQEISKRVYAQWERNGHPDGTEVRDWLETEAELNLRSEQARQLTGDTSPESEQLLRAILANSPAVISVKDMHGRYILANRRYETLFQGTFQQVAGRTDYDFFPTGIADALRANDLRVLATQTPLEFEELVPHRAEVHTYLSLKFPIAGPDGVPYAVCGISTDITARKQAQRRLLAEHAVTRVLSQCFALGPALPRVLEAVCESFGWEVGIFWDVDRNADELRCVEVWHAPLVEIAGFERLCRRMIFPRGVGLAGRVWASGQPGWIADVGADASCPRSAAALREGLHGAFGFPVRNGGEPLGVMEFFSRMIREPDADMLDMMASVCSQVGQFAERRQTEKALLDRERELDLARSIQQARLPKAAPVLAGFDIAGVSNPAQETGGDYLDFIPLPDGSLGVADGDASGHGIAAALLMAETRAYLRALARTETSLGEVLTVVNRHVAEDIGGDFVTLVLARLDPRTRSLVYASAGHMPGYVLNGRGEVRTALPSTGLPLGIDPTAAFPDGAALTLEPGDLVLLLTDGIAEAFSPDGPQFGLARALECVRVHRGATSGAIVAALVDEVRVFSHGLQMDDMTAVVIQVSPLHPEEQVRRDLPSRETTPGGPAFREGVSSKPARAVAFDVDAATLASLRQALPGWEIDTINGATPASLAPNWHPGAADLLVVSARGNATETLRLCRFLSFYTGYPTEARAGGAETLGPRANLPAVRPAASLLVLVAPGQEPLVRAALDAGAHSCLMLPIHAQEVASMLVHAHAGNQPGRHTLNLEGAQSEDRWRDDGGQG